MQIKYKIKLKNPVAQSLSVSEGYTQAGEFTVEKKETGVLIRGEVSKNDTLIKAYNNSYLGETYSLTESDKLSLETVDASVTDVETLFDVIGKSVDTLQFKNIQTSLRKAIKTSAGFKLDIYVEKSSDIFLLKVSKEGLVSGVNGYAKPYSNQLNLDEDVEDYVLLYALVSKPLKLVTDEYMFIPLEDLEKCPNGFCTISNQVYHKTSNQFETLENYSTLSTVDETYLELTTPQLVDGVKLSKTKLRAKEKVIIETSDDLSPLSLSNLKDNILLVYKVTPSNEAEPYLAIVGNSLNVASDDVAKELYDELEKADKEFHKKYLCKEYKTLVSTKHNQYSIFNPDVLNTLLNTEDFLGCILKYE